MSATATTATECRLVEIEHRVKAFYQPDGSLEFRYYNKAGDYVMVYSHWNGKPGMTDEEIKAFYAENEFEIQADFSEGLAANF